MLNNPANLTDPTGFAPIDSRIDAMNEDKNKRDAERKMAAVDCSGGCSVTINEKGQVTKVERTRPAKEAPMGKVGVPNIDGKSGKSANTTPAPSRPDNRQSLGCINQSTGGATPIVHHTGNIVQDMMMDEYSKTASTVWNADRAIWNGINDITILGLCGAAEGGAVAAGSGVWGSIKATQPVWEGTVIPRSFEMLAGGRQIWVHPNATEHMVSTLWECLIGVCRRRQWL